jgi:dipeptide/tripeptide permease
MGLLVILPFAALAAWSIFAIFRWLRRGNFGREWWRAFGILAAVGLLLGIWFAFFLEYKVANTRLAGFPIPVQIANREKPADPWVQSNLPVVVRLGGTITNLLAGVALCLAPIAAAAFFKENRMQHGPDGRPLS